MAMSVYLRERKNSSREVPKKQSHEIMRMSS